MPTYEYRRPDGTTFEVQQSFSEDSLTEDPDTGVPVQRVLHAPAVHFKGKGFYNTDYGTRKRQRETAASTNEGSSSGDSSSGGSSSGDTSGGDSSKSGGSDSTPKGDSASKSGENKGESSSKPAAKSDPKPVAAAK